MEQITYANKQAEQIARLKFFVFEGDDTNPAHIELISIWVREDQRGKGTGTQLIKDLSAIAKERKISSIFVFVTKANEEFKSFLKDNEFNQDEQKELWHLGWS